MPEWEVTGYDLFGFPKSNRLPESTQELLRLSALCLFSP